MSARTLFAPLAALSLLLSFSGCGTDDDVAQGVVRGRVRTQDGSELKQVTVRAGTKSVKTDKDGNFTLHVKAGSERIAVDSKEFAGGEALVNVGKGGEANLELGVMRVSTLEVEDAQKGGQFEGEDGFSLKLPEDALRGAGGRSSKGRAELRYAAVRDAKLMRVPPELRTSDEQGNEQRLKTHGLVEVRFYSGEEQLDIDGEAGVEVEVPLPAGSALKDGDRVDLYHYDTRKGHFEHAGQAEVNSGKWAAKLDKFSWWTIAEPAGATSCVTARLRTPENQPSAGVVASAVGIDELWLASAVSDADGEICLEAPAGSAVQLSAFWDDGEDSGEWSERADVPEGAAMCGGDGCLELGSQLFSATPEEEEPDAGPLPDAGGMGMGALFTGLQETKTATAAGETVSFTFSALGGERLAYTLSSSAASVSDIRILGPDGKPLTVGSGVVSAGSESFDDAFLLPALAGVYTLEVTPRSESGTFTLDLFGVPEDETAEITADGAPVAVEVDSVAQNAALTFNAEGGERLAYSVDSSGDTTADLWLVGPSGTRLALGNLAVSSGSHGFTDQFVLPAVAGEYHIQIDPRQQGTGSFELTLFSVPDDVVVDVEIDGPSTTLTIPSLAQNGIFRLRGLSGGERLAYTIENDGATTVDTVLLNPAGSPVSGTNGATSAGTTRFADSFELPSTPGDYLLTVDPRGEAVAGSFNLVLISVPPDATAALAIGGASSSLSIPSIGQNGAFSFSASGGERLAYTVQNRADGTADLVIVDPNGQRLSATNTAISTGARSFRDEFTLPTVAGSYQLLVDPRDRATGSFDATLLRVPADAVATSTLQTFANASDQRLTTTVAGQNAALDINVSSANAVVAYYVTNGAANALDAQLLNPGGTLVAGSNRAISAGTTGFVDAFALGAAGTYRLRLDPRVEGTGLLSVRIFQVSPARPAATVTAGAGATRIDVTIPGQIAVFSFALNAGQSFSYSVARTGSSVADTRLFDPMQRSVTHSGGAVVSSTPLNVSGVTAAVAGTYTLEVDARNDVTDSYNVTLTTP